MALFIISAPSGSGKSTLVGELMRLVPGLRFSVSYTTRAPRGSEQNGREYFFVDPARFEAMIAEGAFLEYAQVFGHYYGTAWSFLREAEGQGLDLVLDIDVLGAAQVKARLPQATSIFIAPPNRQALEWRLQHRGLDAPAVIAQRLGDASREIGAYNRYDYVVINDRLEAAAEQLCAIVRCRRDADAGACGLAETCRRDRVALRIAPVLASFGLSDPEA